MFCEEERQAAKLSVFCIRQLACNLNIYSGFIPGLTKRISGVESNPEARRQVRDLDHCYSRKMKITKKK